MYHKRPAHGVPVHIQRITKDGVHACTGSELHICMQYVKCSVLVVHHHHQGVLCTVPAATYPALHADTSDRVLYHPQCALQVAMQSMHGAVP